MTPDRIIKTPDQMQLHQLAHLYPALPLGIPLADRGMHPSITRLIDSPDGKIHLSLSQQDISMIWEINRDIGLSVHVSNDTNALFFLHPQVIDGDRVHKELQALKSDAFVGFALAYFGAYGQDIRTITSIWSSHDVNGRNLLRLPPKAVTKQTASEMRDAQIFRKFGFNLDKIEKHPSHDGGSSWFVKFSK